MKLDKILELLKEVTQAFSFNYSLAKAQIQAESNFDVNAQSPVGAVGLAQFMYLTFMDVWNEMRNKGLTDRFELEFDIWNAKTSLYCYGYYFTVMIPRYLRYYGHKDSYENRLRAYNAGIGNITKSHNFEETNNYVSKILRKKGFEVLPLFAVVAVGLAIKGVS